MFASINTHQLVADSTAQTRQTPKQMKTGKLPDTLSYISTDLTKYFLYQNGALFGRGTVFDLAPVSRAGDCHRDQRESSKKKSKIKTWGRGSNPILTTVHGATSVLCIYSSRDICRLEMHSIHHQR